MKDLFQNYHRKKVLSHLGILSLSVILAVSINSFIFSTSNGKMIVANVLDAKTRQAKNNIDFKAISWNESISFQNTQEMKNVVEFSFSLAYNPEILSLKKSISNIPGAYITEILEQWGFASYIITFDSPINIKENSEILSLAFKKLSTDTIQLNIINVNFKDSSDEVFLLTSSGIMF